MECGDTGDRRKQLMVLMGAGQGAKGETMNQASDGRDPKRIVEQGYDRVAQAYGRLEGEAEWPRLRWLRKLLDRLEPGSSVLDLGCGSGDPADIEIAKEHQITGVDISQTQIDLAHRNVPAGHFLHGDAGSVQFPAASFDAVVSFYSLEHIPRQEHEAILHRMYDWLKPGGFLLFSMEADDIEEIVAEWLGVPMFMSCFDPETMKRLVTGTGFEVVETAIESQVEQDHDVPYLWLLACKPPGSRQGALSVSVRELSPVHVAYVEYKPSAEQGDMHDAIGECFRRVQAWLRERGYDPMTRLTIGAIGMVDGRLSSYECCVQVPDEVRSGSGGVGIKELVGGRYAVVNIEKDPRIIGESIGRFYHEYVPQHNLKIDGLRPTYEVYYERTMEYCVPIL